MFQAIQFGEAIQGSHILGMALSMAYNKTFLLNDAQIGFTTWLYEVIWFTFLLNGSIILCIIGYGLLFWIYHITRLDIQQGVKLNYSVAIHSFSSCTIGISPLPMASTKSALTGIHKNSALPNSTWWALGMFRSVPGSSSQKRCVADLPWST